MRQIEILADADGLARAAAEHFAALAEEAIADRGRFAVALAGGSTPRATYALLATEPYRTGIDWSRIHVYWGDERCVPPNHPKSNYRMAQEALLARVPIPLANIHRIACEQDPEQAASAYEKDLQVFFDSPLPRFDLIHLGMGDDGHTASLFPGTAAVHEQTRWAAAHYVNKLDTWRVTLTPVAINAAAQVTFLVSGAAKAERLHQVLTKPRQPSLLPAQIIEPTDGSLLWLVDAAAAVFLKSKT